MDFEHKKFCAARLAAHQILFFFIALLIREIRTKYIRMYANVRKTFANAIEILMSTFCTNVVALLLRPLSRSAVLLLLLSMQMPSQR